MPSRLIIKGLDASRHPRVSTGAALVLIGLFAGLHWLFGDEMANEPVVAGLEEKLNTLDIHSDKTSSDVVSGQSAGEDSPQKVVRTATIRLRRGETPAGALTSAGVDPISAGMALNSMSARVDMRSLKPGRKFAADINADGRVLALRFPINAVEYYESAWNGENFDTTRKELPTEKEIVETACRIQGTLYESFKACGLDRELVPVVTGLLETQFDLFTDIRKGDILRIVVQKESVNGRFLRYGNVEGLLYEGKIASAAAFMHEDENGDVSYWDSEGSSLDRPFIRTPIRYNGYTAGYAKRRLHPILHAYTPGRAVDYSAPRGTHVMAVGDGKVIFAGRRGAHGNTVIIRHAGGLQTYYARLDSIRKGVSRGLSVNKRTLLGTVGSSGKSKGTYLHFAVAKGGRFEHPRILSEKHGVAMPESEKYDFLAYVGRMTGRLRALPVRGTEIPGR